MKYDYLVVGSGLFGSIFAYEANKKGKKILVVEKRANERWEELKSADKEDPANED